MNPTPDTVLLTVRGTLVPKTLEEARRLHNETAGSPPGIAAARALGDLSHNVYAPSLRSKQSTAKDGELLFLDRWDDVRGIMSFFSDPHVQQQGAALFGAKEPTIWVPARGAFAYALPAPNEKRERCVGMIRGPIESVERAVQIFADVDRKGQREARRRGILSHEIFIKLRAPGDDSPLELLGLDLFCDFAGMGEHYADTDHVAPLRAAFCGPAQPSAWEAAPGSWSEW
jgi:hypothetical protein